MGEKLFINWTTKFQDTMTKIYKDENIVTGNTKKYKPNQTNFRHPVHTHLFKRFDTPVKGYGVSCTNILFVLLGFKTSGHKTQVISQALEALEMACTGKGEVGK